MKKQVYLFLFTLVLMLIALACGKTGQTLPKPQILFRPSSPTPLTLLPPYGLTHINPLLHPLSTTAPTEIPADTFKVGPFDYQQELDPAIFGPNLGMTRNSGTTPMTISLSSRVGPGKSSSIRMY